MIWLSLLFAAALPDRIAVVPPTALLELTPSLSVQERRLLHTLSDTVQALRPVVLYQTHRHGLRMHARFHAAFTGPGLTKTRASFPPGEYAAVVRYVLAFVHNAGPYDLYANRKLVLEGVDRTRVARWLGDDEIARLMTDPAFEPVEYPSAAGGLAESGGNLYEQGVAGATAAQMSPHPNQRITKKGLQTFAVSDVTLEPEIRAALQKAVACLKQAASLTSSAEQRVLFGALAEYFATGEPEAAMRAERAFIKDTSRVRFYAAFLYPYFDWQQKMHKLEATLLEVDPRLAHASKTLAEKERGIAFVAGLLRAGGRDDPGLHLEVDGSALNLIPLLARAPLEHPWAKEHRAETFRAFLGQAQVSATEASFASSVTTMLVLHELLGHGSGSVELSGATGASAEELRANLVGFSLFSDPRLVAARLAADARELEAQERAWVLQYIASTGREVAQGHPIVWPHKRAALLLVNYWLETKAVARDGGFSIPDLTRFRRANRSLLDRLQAIAAAKDQRALDALYETYAPIDPSKSSWIAAFPAARALKEEPVLLTQPFHFDANDNIALDGDPAQLDEMAGLLTR